MSNRIHTALRRKTVSYESLKKYSGDDRDYIDAVTAVIASLSDNTCGCRDIVTECLQKRTKHLPHRHCTSAIQRLEREMLRLRSKNAHILSALEWASSRAGLQSIVALEATKSRFSLERLEDEWSKRSGL